MAEPIDGPVLAPMTLVEMWPVAGLRVRTPVLELRPIDTEVGVGLANLAAQGIHDPDFMPFLVPWTDVPSPALQANCLRHFWESWSLFRPEAWRLGFGVFVDDELVGSQGATSRDFPLLRTAETGSWLGQRYQGRGYGKEMRAAILHLLFAGLDAVQATTGAFDDNAPSLGVTRALGYEPNGSHLFARRGERAVEQLFVLPRERWATDRRDDIVIDGLDHRCLAMFGLDHVDAPRV